MSNEAGVVWWGRQDRRPHTFRAKAAMLLPHVDSITAAEGQHNWYGSA